MITSDSMPMHTITFEAPNQLIRETYQCQNWDEFHKTCQLFDARGWTRVEWIDRSDKVLDARIFEPHRFLAY